MNTAVAERVREHTVVTIQYVNEPKGAAVSGSIKDTNSEYYSVHKSGLAQVRGQEGRRVEFDFVTDANGFRNVDVKTLQMVAPDPTNYPSRNAPPRAQPAQAARGPVRQSDPIEQPRQEPPRPQPNGNGGQFCRPTSPKDARRMFICSQMNALITSHQVQPNAQSIADAIAMLSDAYDMTLGQEDQA